MTVKGLWVWRWGSIGLNLTAPAAGGGSGALLHIAMADILPQETIANLNGKQQGCYFRITALFQCWKVLVQPALNFPFSLTYCFVLALYPHINKKIYFALSIIPKLVIHQALMFSLNNVVLYSKLNIQYLWVDPWAPSTRLTVVTSCGLMWTPLIPPRFKLTWSWCLSLEAGCQRPFHIKVRQLGQAGRLLKAELLLNYFWECIIHYPERSQGKGGGVARVSEEKKGAWNLSSLLFLDTYCLSLPLSIPFLHLLLPLFICHIIHSQISFTSPSHYSTRPWEVAAVLTCL